MNLKGICRLCSVLRFHFLLLCSAGRGGGGASVFASALAYSSPPPVSVSVFRFHAVSAWGGAGHSPKPPGISASTTPKIKKTFWNDRDLSLFVHQNSAIHFFVPLWHTL